MASFKMVTSLLAFWFLVLELFSTNHVCCLPVDGAGKGSASIRECSTKVLRPLDLRPRFQIGSNLLPFEIFHYHLSTNNTAKVCTLNITRLFQKLPLRSRFSQLTFSVECSSPLKVVFRRSEHLTKFFVHSILEISGPCEITTKDLAVWGRATDLWRLRLSNGVVVREDENQTARDLEGLLNLGSLSFSRLSSKGIPRIFTSFVWEKMGELRFIDIPLTSIPDVLNQTMPNLQSLYFYDTRLQRPPNFPWCNTRLELPGNLSRAALKKTVNSRMYPRYLTVESNPTLDVGEFEFMTSSLDSVSLRDNGLKHISSTIFDKTSELKSIYLSGNKFRKVPAEIFRKVNGLENIYLDNNRLEFIAKGTFRELKELRMLDLSNNFLRTLPSDFLSGAENLTQIMINLKHNRLVTLPKNFQNLNFSFIDIQNNFFTCDCRNKWMKTWLSDMESALVGGAKTVLCTSEKNRGKPLVSVGDDNFTCLTESSLLLMIACILGGLLLTFIVLGLIYRFRREAKLFLFTRFRWHPFDRVDDSDPSKVYDAFVSYSSHDREWVLNTLREKLESEDPPFKLCIHDRDFMVGAPIFQNIFDSVKTSRRMIMVLSKDFVQSEWCMLEFRAAHRRVLRDRTNYLIIILFADVDTKNLDDELKLYLRTNTYLAIDNKWFWQKLRYALPERRRRISQTRLVEEENVGYESEPLL